MDITDLNPTERLLLANASELATAAGHAADRLDEQAHAERVRASQCIARAATAVCESRDLALDLSKPVLLSRGDDGLPERLGVTLQPAESTAAAPANGRAKRSRAKAPSR